MLFCFVMSLLNTDLYTKNLFEMQHLTQLKNSLTEQFEVNLFMLRLDLYNSEVPGNKWFKLKYNLQKATHQEKKTLLTFGGAYSNHIFATASAAKKYGFQAIGIIRGEEHLPLNPVLEAVKNLGMQLHYLDRTTYREKHTENVLDKLYQQFGNFYLLPEGGSNHLAVKGCTEIWDLINIPCEYLCTAMGTGGTITGLIAGNKSESQIIGFPSLKGASFLYDDVKQLLTSFYEKNPSFPQKETQNWQINNDYHFGGYAKFTAELMEFMQDFEQQQGITLERIYTAKMLFGIYDLIKKGKFEKGANIIAIHSGGVNL